MKEHTLKLVFRSVVHVRANRLKKLVPPKDKIKENKIKHALGTMRLLMTCAERAGSTTGTESQKIKTPLLCRGPT